jgi:hypothetical protein
MVTVSEQCRACIVGLENVVSSLSRSRPGQERGVHHGQVSDELERLSLWTGNIGALHRAGHSMSLESRLIEARDVLTHILELLDDLNSATGERGIALLCLFVNQLTRFSFRYRLRGARRGDSLCISRS